MAKRKAQAKQAALEPAGADPHLGGINKRHRARTVAISGSSSFLGRNLIGLLEEDPRIGRIVALDVRPPATAGAKTHYYEVDFTQPTSEARMAEIFSAERVHTMVHLAFLSLPTHATAWAHEFESVGTMHLLNAARQGGVTKLVHWSQSVLYGARPSNPNFLTEQRDLRAPKAAQFFQDKIDAEAEAQRFGERKGTVVTVLRTAPILGPTVRNYVTRFLGHRLVPVLMGFDPLWQFVHEVDAVAAFKLAVDRDIPGTFNIVSQGVLPLSTVVRLAGRLALPIPHPVAIPLAGALWAAQLIETPPGFVDYLRYLCVADGARAERELGFRASYSSRDAVLDFATAQHLRDVRLLDEPAV